MRIVKALAAVSALIMTLAITGCGGSSDGGSAGNAGRLTPEQASANAVTETGTGVRVAIEVTDQGFVPAAVNIPSGRPVTLAVTRKTDKTCATELILKDYAIDLKLPLNQTVEATFTPTQPGELRYACGMDMITGILIVQ
jgi:plastocyanin domain-containing protein